MFHLANLFRLFYPHRVPLQTAASGATGELFPAGLIDPPFSPSPVENTAMPDVVVQVDRSRNFPTGPSWIEEKVDTCTVTETETIITHRSRESSTADTARLPAQLSDPVTTTQPGVVPVSKNKVH